MPSCGGWSGAWRPSSWRSVSERWMRQRSGRLSPVRARPSTGRQPRPRGCASGASPSGERRADRTETRGTMNAKTYSVREGEIDRRWYVVDASDETLGRLASRIARVLEGKHKPTYQPSLDGGDHVIVLNASHITVTRNKLESKLYSRHSGYPQGFKQETL